MYNIEDIDIFIATHNRADMLRETIECLQNQTISLPQVIVLDNESPNNTEEVVKEYENQGFKYVKTYTRSGNFLKAQELASKEFCIIFHDDNLIHPQFFERMLFGLNPVSGLSGIAPSYLLFKNKTELLDDDIDLGLIKSFLICENWLDFCIMNIQAETRPWPKISPGTPALIYKTEILKNRTDMTSIYGKTDDLDLYKGFCQMENLLYFYHQKHYLLESTKIEI